MDINKAKKVIELSKPESQRKILITLWEGGRLSSCEVEEEKPKSCFSCEGDEALCQEFIEHLKEKGYEATEIELGEVIEETLPRFLEERVKPEVKEEE